MRPKWRKSLRRPSSNGGYFFTLRSDDLLRCVRMARPVCLVPLEQAKQSSPCTERLGSHGIFAQKAKRCCSRRSPKISPQISRRISKSFVLGKNGSELK